MPDEPATTSTPNFVTCPCQYCNGGIEFDASGFEKGETRTVECPHCHLETMVFMPEITATTIPAGAKPPPLLKAANPTAAIVLWIVTVICFFVAVALSGGVSSDSDSANSISFTAGVFWFLVIGFLITAIISTKVYNTKNWSLKKARLALKQANYEFDNHETACFGLFHPACILL